MLIAVRVKDDWPLPELALQAIGIEFGLLLPDAGVTPRPLGLDEPERLAVVAPEDVVHEALALRIRHPANLEFAVAVLIERPASLLEQQVDVVVAGLGLGIVVRVRLRGSLFLGLGHLTPQALEFLVERALVRQQRRELLVALPESFLKRAQLFGSLLLGRRGPGQRRRIEGKPGRRAPGAGVGPGEPVGHVVELAQRRQRVRFRHGAVAVHRAIAERVDHPGLAEHRFACGLLEARLVDQRREVVLIG